MVTTRSYKEYLLEQLQDPEEAAEYLNACLQDDDPRVFLLALQDVAEAMGGMGLLADRTNLNRENLYRVFSQKGNPRFFTLLAVLKALEVEFSLRARAGKKAKSHRTSTRRRKIKSKIGSRRVSTQRA